MPPHSRRPWLAPWTAALSAVGLLVVLATFRDYGITWDEPVQSYYGEGVLRYFTSGLQDRSVDEFLHMRFYGPLFELGAAIAYAGAPDAKYEIRHLLIALCGLAAVLGVLRFATHLPGRLVPLFAPLALVALPRFYGHAFNNSKDIPFAAAFVWAMVATLRFATHDRDRDGVRPALLCGLGLGVTLALRPGGLPMLGLLFGTALAWRVLASRAVETQPLGRRMVQAATASAVVWAVAWAAMVLLWPWAHESPIVNPVRAVVAALSFPDTFPVLFEGEVTRSDVLPRYYLAKYLWITTPPSVLLLAIGGLGVAAARAWRHPRAPGSGALVLAGSWLLAPLALAIVGRPNVYDGMRHLLFALPALALFAGLGGSAAVEASMRAARRWLEDRSRLPLGPLTTAAMTLALLSPLGWHVRLHPYQSTYFNGFVGGMSGANGRYETDYWLSSYKEAIEWVNARAAEGGRPVRVLVAADPYSAECAGRFLGPDVEMVRTADQGMPGAVPAPFDYYVGTTRYGMDRNFPGSPVAHRVGREGATFAVVRARAPHKRGLSANDAASPADDAGPADAPPGQPPRAIAGR